MAAVELGASHLWANMILFGEHPLPKSTALDEYAAELKIVGQPPRLVDRYDDKNFVNELLRSDGSLAPPKSWIFDTPKHSNLQLLPFPVIAKSIRGRGSHGVKLCSDALELSAHLQMLLKDDPQVMVEQCLNGQEGTVTVMPPTPYLPRYWALPFVHRFGHDKGVAPYNGAVAVTANSRARNPKGSKSAVLEQLRRDCEHVAKLLNVTAPICIDVRQAEDNPDSRYVLFDVNVKPNMTGPGRPGREDQARLTGLAAEAHGWNYSELLKQIVATAQSLQVLRDGKP